MEPISAEYREHYPDIQHYARGDSGFATPKLYDLFEDTDVKYGIRLKINKTLLALAQDDVLVYNIFNWLRGQYRLHCVRKRQSANHSIVFPVTIGPEKQIP